MSGAAAPLPAPPADEREGGAAPAGPSRWATCREIVLRIGRECVDDDLLGESAKVAYFSFISLFPLILTLFALTGIFGGDQAFSWTMQQLQVILPREAATTVAKFVHEVTGSSRPGILSFAIIVTLWTASNLFAALASALNTIYGVRETRSFWQRRGLALLLIMLLDLALVLTVTALVTGPEVLGYFDILEVWGYVRWPAIFILLIGPLWLMYYLLPAYDQSHSKLRLLAGATIASASWVLGSVAFRFWVARFGNVGKVYGFVGGTLILLIWLYITAFIILLGGELSAVLESRTRGRVRSGDSGEIAAAP